MMVCETIRYSFVNVHYNISFVWELNTLQTGYFMYFTCVHFMFINKVTISYQCIPSVFCFFLYYEVLSWFIIHEGSSVMSFSCDNM